MSVTETDLSTENTDSAAVPAAVGYSLVLPPGWVRIGLRDPRRTEAGVKHALDTAFAGYGRDRVAQVRREAEQGLRDQVAAAKKAEGLDLYLPVTMMHGMAVPASFLVSEGRFDTQLELDASEMILSLATGSPAAETVAVDGSVAVRTRKTVAADPERSVESESTRVEYIVAVPGDANRWLLIAFSVLGVGDLADLLTDLFDAVMSTFYWRLGAES